MDQLLQCEMWETKNCWASRPCRPYVKRLTRQAAALAHQPTKSFRLVFDSACQRALTGARGALSARQLLYETDDRYIDVRIEPLRQTDRACVVGQLVGRGNRDKIGEGVAVRLQQGNQAIAETTTNEFGEFQMEFHAAKHLNISIGAEQERITLPLYEV